MAMVNNGDPERQSWSLKNQDAGVFAACSGRLGLRSCLLSPVGFLTSAKLPRRVPIVSISTLCFLILSCLSAGRLVFNR